MNRFLYQRSTAVCAQRAQRTGRPPPLLTMCPICPDARRSSVHLPRRRVARPSSPVRMRDDFGYGPGGGTPVGTPRAEIVRAAGARWAVEECFQSARTKLASITTGSATTRPVPF